jgi:hypothetical protein
MDPTTLDAYDRTPAVFAQDWETQPAPVDLHALVTEFFRPGATADIGCGSGRDTAWRVTEGADQRDDAGRLYSAFGAATVRAALEGTGILHDEERTSVSSGRTVHRIVARRPSA